MDVNELVAMLTEGLTAEQAAIVRDSVMRDAVKTKVGGLKQGTEYQATADEMARLKAELEGGNGKHGARTIAEWYAKNADAITAVQTRAAAYEAKYGPIEGGTAVTPPATGGKTYTDEDISRLIDKRVQETIVPNFSRNFIGANKVIVQHMRTGRKTELDLEALAKDAAEKHSGSLEAAYDAWDRPERERISKEQTDAEVTRRVNEELQKRGAGAHFPAAADSTPGALSSRSKADVDKFDKRTMTSDLVSSWLEAGSGRTQ